MNLQDFEHDIGNSTIVKGVEGFFGEFWSFAAKGNIFDLAIGVVVGNKSIYQSRLFTSI